MIVFSRNKAATQLSSDAAIDLVALVRAEKEPRWTHGSWSCAGRTAFAVCGQREGLSALSRVRVGGCLLNREAPVCSAWLITTPAMHKASAR